MKHLALGIALFFSASAAHAEWLYSGGEGTYYAYVTDGGFVEGSFQNGMHVWCADDRNYCSLEVWIDGEVPQPPAIITFSFASGQTIQRMADWPPGATRPLAGFDEELQAALMSETSVTVSVANGGSHTFSLSGSSAAIRQAMDF